MSTINPAKNKFIPTSNNFTKTNEQNTSIDPIERSNSPQIINIPTPRAMMLNSDPSAKRTSMFPRVMKRYWEKKVNNNTRPLNIRKILEDLYLRKNLVSFISTSSYLETTLPAEGSFTINSESFSMEVSSFLTSATLFPRFKMTNLSATGNT